MYKPIKVWKINKYHIQVNIIEITFLKRCGTYKFQFPCTFKVIPLVVFGISVLPHTFCGNQGPNSVFVINLWNIDVDNQDLCTIITNFVAYPRRMPKWIEWLLWIWGCCLCPHLYNALTNSLFYSQRFVFKNTNPCAVDLIIYMVEKIDNNMTRIFVPSGIRTPDLWLRHNA